MRLNENHKDLKDILDKKERRMEIIIDELCELKTNMEMNDDLILNMLEGI